MKNLIKILAILSILCTMCISASAAELVTKIRTEGDVIAVEFCLDSMPDDLTEISSITLKIKYDTTKLTWLRTEPGCEKLKENLVASQTGNIVWYVGSLSKSLTAEDISSAGGLLFTQYFSKAEGVSRKTTIDYTTVEFTDFRANKSTQINTEPINIAFPASIRDEIIISTVYNQSVVREYDINQELVSIVRIGEIPSLNRDETIYFNALPAFYIKTNNGEPVYFVVSVAEIDISKIWLVDEAPKEEIAGDTNGDRIVTAVDAQLALQRAVRKVKVFDDDLKAYVRADIAGEEGESMITARDALAIARLALSQ